MLKGLTNILGNSNEKALKKLEPVAEEIGRLEAEVRALSDEELRAKTDEFRGRLQSGEALDDILPEAFAVVREASKRTMGMRHFDVQLMGGTVLHHGKIAEMKTGEGKTLVATLPVYLNALVGRGAHLVTVNDYLAKRDTQWMGAVYHFLGLSVGCLQHNASYLFDPAIESEDPSFKLLRPVFRKEAYHADITYGTNNEFGFDYLRDNMAGDLSQKVQRELYYAIVDEVDNILIDEARTPLIISGPAQESAQLYLTFAKLAPRLSENRDYTIDEKRRVVSLTETGIASLEKWLKLGNLYDPQNYYLTHFVENALRAEVLFKRDRDYVVRSGEVVIVDEFTGRLMTGRRYSDGLHQAIEAKEGVKVQRETITYATITLQNYFRMYQKLAGMTGTAVTEAEEFWKIYKLEVVAVATNKPMIREDRGDFIYQTEDAKYLAIVEEISEANKREQPVLVGTTDIAKSERISDMLDRQGVKHQVLNAKHHEREAHIVVQAGRPGAVTVATNMAGRGTDIVLGGNPSGLNIAEEEWQADHDKVVSLGGLHIIGTERHEARRIDNQLRGRAGRQGDPGSSRFYVSLEDDLMRRFGGERIQNLMTWAKMDVDVPIENRMVSKSIEAAQVKVEAHHFEIRKHLVDFDDVVNRHREVIYTERDKVLSGSDMKANIRSMITQEIEGLVADHLSARDSENWDLGVFIGEVSAMFPLPPDMATPEQIALVDREEVSTRLVDHVDEVYMQREGEIGEEEFRTVERAVMLRTIDSNWVEHLTAMENLRQGIGLHAYGQRDPLVMFKREGYEMFERLLAKIQRDVARTILRVELRVDGRPAQRPNQLAATRAPVMSGATSGGSRPRSPGPQGGQKTGRNDSCPCGSGKKYKRCHGA